MKTFYNWRIIKGNSIFFILLVAILLLGVFWERMQVNNGMGWDGCVYTSSSVDFGQKLLSKSINNYYIQRMLSPAIIWAFTKIFNIQLDFQKAISGFIILNFLFILLSLVYYLKLVRELNLGNKIKWIGFIAIFLTFPILKFSMYYPTLLDTTAFSIGIINLYYFFKNSIWGLSVCAFLGAFVYPSIMWATIVLIILPNKPLPYPEKKSTLDYTVLFFVLILIWFFFRIYDSSIPVNGTNPINKALFPLTYACLVIYFGVVFNKLFPGLIPTFDYLKKNLQIKPVLISILIIIVTRSIIYFSTLHGQIFSPENFFTNIVYQAKTNPFIFLVAHTVYFGPFVLLLLFFFKVFVKEVYNKGLGLLVFITVYMFIGTGSESRQFINAYPYFFILLLIAIRNYDYKTIHVVIFGGISLFISRFWYPMNHKPFEGSFLEFPYQNYFMFQGPWMSNTMYYLQGACMVLLIIVFYFYTKKLKLTAHV